MIVAGRLERAWLLVLGLTLTAVLAGWLLQSVWLLAVVWVITLVKGRTVAQVFMGLDRAPRLLRHAVDGWLMAAIFIPALLRLL